MKQLNSLTVGGIKWEKKKDWQRKEYYINGKYGGLYGEESTINQKPASINKAFRKANAGQTFPDRSQHFIYETN